MTRLFTPLVLGTTVLVSALAIIRFVLSPDSWASSLLALVFLPLALGAMVLRARLSNQPARDTRTSGKIRAALVGAGAALSFALLLSIAEAFGFSELDMSSKWPVFGTLLIALVGAAADLIAARLEQKASDED